MTSIRTVEGRLTDAGGRKFALVVTRWNSFIVDRLQQAAIDCLLRHGVSEDDVTVVRCPGAVEIPIVARRLADRGQFDAIIALGAVIRGGTPHFEYVAGECASGIGSINRAGTVPVAFGVLTVDTVEQAIERAGGKAGNKGEEAAATALEMVSLLDQLD